MSARLTGTCVAAMLMLQSGTGIPAAAPDASAAPTVPAPVQTAAEAAKRPAPPIRRTPDGRPDFRGVWRITTPGTYDIRDPRTGGGRLDEILKQRAGTERRRQPNRIVDPPDGQVPYQPWAAAKQRYLEATIDTPTRPEHIDTQVRCLPVGVPRIFYFPPFQIEQSAAQLVIVTEQYHLFRVIPLDGRPHIAPTIHLWMGDSRGRWDGDTLVIDVTNTNAKWRFDMIGNFASDAVHLVERWTPVDGDLIDYQITVTDPTVYTRPWTMAGQFRRQVDPEEFWEDSCHEGERSADSMVQTPASDRP